MVFIEEFKKKEFNLKNEVLSGLTVSLALVPEAVAFSLIAGVSPLVGLYSAFIIGLIAAVLGGRPGMISGATGAIAVVIISLVAQHGVEYLFAAVVLMGVIQIAIGALRLGKFIRLVPHAVMYGFVNGLAAVKFAWENALRIRARKRIDENGVKHYEIYGPLFFGSVGLFQEKFKVHEDPDEIIIDFEESRVVDHSAIEALNKVTERYAKVGKKVHLKHLSSDCRSMLDNASAIIDVNYWEDPKYKLVSDKLA